MKYWFSHTYERPTLNYRLFKNKFEFENYFNILDDRDIFTFCHFRLNNHKLPIEYGRWNNIPRELRICNLCNTADLIIIKKNKKKLKK
jgi:hypothetical protein